MKGFAAVSVDTLSAIFFGLYQAFTQAYSMSMLFLLAGYFIPYSMAGHGAKHYIIIIVAALAVMLFFVFSYLIRQGAFLRKFFVA